MMRRSEKYIKSWKREDVKIQTMAFKVSHSRKATIFAYTFAIPRDGNKKLLLKNFVASEKMKNGGFFQGQVLSLKIRISQMSQMRRMIC